MLGLLWGNRLDRNPVALHGGLKISYGGHQRFDARAVVPMLSEATRLAANDGSFTVNLSRALAVFEEKQVRQLRPANG